MDIRMPVLDGIAATRELTALGLPTRVLVLTTYDLDGYVYDALRAGAAGFLLKATPPDRLVAGIETVAAGESLLAPSLTRRLIEEHVRRPAPADGVPERLRVLTERELEVFTLIARGLSQRGHLRPAGGRRGDGQDAREPGAGQARRPHPGGARRARLRDRPGPPRGPRPVLTGFGIPVFGPPLTCVGGHHQGGVTGY